MDVATSVASPILNTAHASTGLSKLRPIAEWRVDFVDEPLSTRLLRPIWSGPPFEVYRNPKSAEYQLSYAGVANFSVSFAQKLVRVWCASGASSQSVRHLLVDQVIPRILAHQGDLVLHAAGVQRDDGLILLVGTSGSGKSSLAASLHNKGHHLVGDDVIVVTASETHVAGQAVYRSLRLFPDSIDALVNSEAGLTPVACYTAKQNVAFSGDDRSDEPLPIRAAFVLDPPCGSEIGIERMTSSEACMAFVEHSFWMDPTDLLQTKKRLTDSSALAGRVPVFRIAYPREYGALSAVHEAMAGVLR